MQPVTLSGTQPGVETAARVAARPPGYRPRHRRQWRRARQLASERQCAELRWWLAQPTEGAR